MNDISADEDFIGTFDLAYLAALYLLYLVGGLITLIPSYTLTATLIMLVAIFLTWLKKRNRHPVLATHYLWLRRTFWIGMGVYLSVITLAVMVTALPAMDTDALMNAMVNGTISTPEQMSELLLAQQPKSNLIIMAVLGGVFALWWCWRCGHGLWQLYRQQPIPHPTSWA